MVQLGSTLVREGRWGPVALGGCTVDALGPVEARCYATIEGDAARDAVTWVAAWSELAEVASARGEHLQAITRYDQCLPVLSSIPDPSTRTRVLLRRGYALLHVGRPSCAGESFHLAARSAVDNSRADWAEALTGVARAYSDDGDQDAAEAVIGRLSRADVPTQMQSEIAEVLALIQTRRRAAHGAGPGA